MVLTEAVIRRLSSRYDETLIRAIHQMGAISLQNEKEAQAYVEQLKILMPIETINFEVKENQDNNTFLIEVNQYVHGNLQTSTLDSEFLLSGEYKQIIKSSLETKLS